MKIGIIVYSQTGNTLSVAGQLKERLIQSGHAVSLEQVSVAGGRKGGDRVFQLETRPDVAPYEGLIFGSAVEAFSLCPVLKTYLQGIGSLDGKTVGCLVTEAFPYPWLGGNHAIRQMRKLCQSKDGRVVGTAVVNWAQSRREQTTKQAVETLSTAF
jgi:hypothetical protein